MKRKREADASVVADAETEATRQEAARQVAARETARLEAERIEFARREAARGAELREIALQEAKQEAEQRDAARDAASRSAVDTLTPQQLRSPSGDVMIPCANYCGRDIDVSTRVPPDVHATGYCVKLNYCLPCWALCFAKDPYSGCGCKSSTLCDSRSSRSLSVLRCCNSVHLGYDPLNRSGDYRSPYKCPRPSSDCSLSFSAVDKLKGRLRTAGLLIAVRICRLVSVVLHCYHSFQLRINFRDRLTI